MELYVKKGANFSKKLTSLSIDLLTYMKSNFEYFSIYENRYFINKFDLQDNPTNVNRIREIYKYIYEHYDSKITLRELAEEKHFNMYYLSHIIKDFVGISFKELLNFARVEISEKLLLETGMRISEIALSCGFSATRYYIKSFESWYSQTPEEYRTQRISHAKAKIKRQVLPLQEILDCIEREQAQEAYQGNPLLRDFYAKVIPLNSEARLKRSLTRNNILSITTDQGAPDLLDEKMFELLRNKFELAEIISASGDRPEQQLLRRFEFMAEQNINQAIYEFSSEKNIQNHIKFFETLFSMIRIHGLDTKNHTLFITDQSGDPTSFAYLLDYLDKETSLNQLFKIQPIPFENSIFDHCSYVFDSICGTAYMLHDWKNKYRIR